jgi:xeroderma pigmentosum group C-complementing protein
VQPLKYKKLSKKSDSRGSSNLDQDLGKTAMYAAYQTEPYVPPPVVRGRIPRNAYGNIDVYVPSMIPPGGWHASHPDAARAARLLGVDYADAVIGFQFKGRRGTAIIQGAIIAIEYKEAVEAVIEGFAHVAEQTNAEQVTQMALRMWKRFYIGLQIVRRIESYNVQQGENQILEGPANSATEQQSIAGGGFFQTEEQQYFDNSPNDRYTLESAMAIGSRGKSAKLANRLIELSEAEEPGEINASGMKDDQAYLNAQSHQRKITLSEISHVTVPDSVSEQNNEIRTNVRSDHDEDEGGMVQLPRQSIEASQWPKQVQSQDVSVSDPGSRKNDEETSSLLSHDPEDSDADPDWLTDS